MNVIQQAAAGKRSALNTLYENHKQRVYFIAKQLLRNEKEAAEVFRTVFLRLFKALPATEEEFEARLTAETLSLCKKKLNKELRVPKNGNFYLPAPSEPVNGPFLAGFPVLHRTALVLQVCCGLQPAELASFLNLDTASLKQLQDAQLRNVATVLGQQEEAARRAVEQLAAEVQRARVSEGAEEAVLKEIHALASVREKTLRNRLLVSVGGVVLFAAIVLGIVFVAQKGDKVFSTAGNGQGTTQQVEDGVLTTGNLDPEKVYYADIDIQDHGVITVKLDQKAAPVTCSNFVKLAQEGFYDGLTFHRIIEGFMMQGGCPQGTGYGGSDQKILGEFKLNGVKNELSHTRGAISMARSGEYNSASSQFFIVHDDDARNSLDGKYAAFGYVTAGIEIVDAICESAKPTDGNGSIAKKDQPIIKTVSIRIA